MLFHVRMHVHLPHDLDPTTRAETIAREKDYSQHLQQAGKWPHIWRIVGEYANVSIFDVESNEELHALLSGLPLFPYMDVHVTPLATHPSDIRERSRNGLSLTGIWRVHQYLRFELGDGRSYRSGSYPPWLSQSSRAMRTVAIAGAPINQGLGSWGANSAIRGAINSAIAVSYRT